MAQTPTARPSVTSSPAPVSKPNHTGAIVGGVIGAVALVAIAVLGTCIVRRRSREQQSGLGHSNPSELTGGVYGHGPHEKGAVADLPDYHEMEVPKAGTELYGSSTGVELDSRQIR